MKPPMSRDPRGSAGSDKGPQLLTDRIRASEVRLVGEEETYGVVSRKEAEALAAEKGLDLIIMSLDSSPPVVKLMDFGKYKYERDRKEREARKKQHVIEVKEIKMGVRIDKHDFEIKLQRAINFLSEGDKVKCTIRLRGREMQHTDIALGLANKFVEQCKDVSIPDNPPKMEGRAVIFVLTPTKKK